MSNFGEERGEPKRKRKQKKVPLRDFKTSSERVLLGTEQESSEISTFSPSFWFASSAQSVLNGET